MKCRKSGNRIAPSCWVRSQGVMYARFAGSCSTESTKPRSDCMVGRRRSAAAGSGRFMRKPEAADGSRGGRTKRSRASDVDLHLVGVALHQVAARLRLALAHEPRQRLGGGREAVDREAQLKQPARLGVQRRVPELLGVHLAQALEAADRPAVLLRAFLLQLVE